MRLRNDNKPQVNAWTNANVHVHNDNDKGFDYFATKHGPN